MTAVAAPVTSARTFGEASAPSRQPKELSPNAMARLAAVLTLVMIVGGVVAQAVLIDPIIVSGNAAATAHNIVANQAAIRAAFATFMVEMACQIGTTAVMYELLAPVDRGLARTAAAFGYVGGAIKILARVFLYSPLYVLSGSSYLSSFNQSQLETISYLLLRINNLGAGTACIFLGASTMMFGCLMLRASFLPRVLGLLGLVGGTGWLVYLYPPLTSVFFLPVALFALFGCVVTIGWFVIRGVDEKKWYETLAISASSIWR